MTAEVLKYLPIELNNKSGFKGPFVCETNVGKVLYGLTSWSFTRTGCGAPGVPDGFADVRTALSWIQKVRKFMKF